MTLPKEDTAGYVSLDEIVHSYKLWMGDFGNEEYDRLLDITIGLFTDLNIHHLRQVRQAYSDVNTDLNQVLMPNDCVDDIAIGIIVNERLYVLTENPNISLVVTEDCGEETRDTDTSDSNIYGATNSTNSAVNGWTYINSSTPLYGLSGGFEDVYYILDWENRRIRLEGNVVSPSKIYFQYISSGVSLTSETVIPLYVKKALVAGVRWMVTETDPSVGGPEKMRLAAIYGTEIAKVKRIKWRFNLQQFKSAMWRSMRRGIRRA